MDAEGLRVDGQRGDPGSVLTALHPRPLLGWTPPPAGVESARVELRDDSDGRLLWAATVPGTERQVEVPSALPPYGRFRWRVRAGDGAAAEQAFETGPWALADWEGVWMEAAAGAVVRTEFELRAGASGDAGGVSGRLYLAGQGIVVARINGVPVNPDRLDPSRTDLARALYRTFDVGRLLRAGRNTLEVLLGRGEWHKTGLPPRFLVQLLLIGADGTRRWVVPDETSEVLSSEVEVDEPFYLERVRPQAAGRRLDPARRVRAAASPATPGTTPGIAPGTAAATPGIAPARVGPDGGPPVRAHEPLAAVEVGRIDGARQFDVGINIAGRSRIVLVSGVPEGTVVSVVHGEHLDARGRIDTTNITMPFDHGRERQVIERVCEGRPGEVVEAVFAYHGFRYLEVRGVPDDARIEATARPFHSALALRGRIEVEHETIALLMDRAVRTALNNVHGVPEDCPTREQAAWTGDMASAVDFHFAQFDDAAFMQKWLGDLATSQGAEGDIPGVAPNIGERQPSDPVWGSALHRVLWNHWLHVGDERLLRELLPAVQRWGRYQLSCRGDRGVVDGFPISYGQDWLALEQTPAALIHSGAVVDGLLTLAALEDVAGTPAAGQEWRRCAEELRGRMREVFLDETLSVGNGSQGSLAVALESGMLSPDEAAVVADRLVAAIRARGNRVSSGFALTRSVVRALAAHGRSAVILDCLTQPAEPGIGAMLASGPGTFWENWWIDPGNTGTGSLDHLGLGAPFAAWVWEHVVGIRPTDRGYRRFRVEPALLAAVPDVDASVDTPLGTVRVRQRRSDTTVALTVEVPVGASATLVLPGRDPVEVGAGRHELSAPAVEPRAAGAGAGAAAATAAPAGPRWSPPAIAPVPADERGATRIDTAARPEPAAGAPAIEPVERLVCMPVPHAQFGHPVVHVRAAAAADEATVLFRLAAPVRPGPGFLFAWIDQCLDAAEGRLVLVAHLAGGGRVRAEARSWPASWNRVTLDLRGLPDPDAVVAVEAGVRSLAESAERPLAFHLGEVGVSPLVPRW